MAPLAFCGLGLARGLCALSRLGGELRGPGQFDVHQYRQGVYVGDVGVFPGTSVTGFPPGWALPVKKD